MYSLTKAPYQPDKPHYSSTVTVTVKAPSRGGSGGGNGSVCVQWTVSYRVGSETRTATFTSASAAQAFARSFLRSAQASVSCSKYGSTGPTTTPGRYGTARGVGDTISIAKHAAFASIPSHCGAVGSPTTSVIGRDRHGDPTRYAVSVRYYCRPRG